MEENSKAGAKPAKDVIEELPGLSGYHHNEDGSSLVVFDYDEVGIVGVVQNLEDADIHYAKIGELKPYYAGRLDLPESTIGKMLWSVKPRTTMFDEPKGNA